MKSECVRSTILICIIAVCACCSQKPFDLSRYEKQYLIFGQGGGFTGIRQEYVILENGSIYSRNPTTDSLEFVKDIGRSFARQAVENYKELGFDKISCYEPGDIYYYIENHSAADVHRIVWGKPGFTQQPMIITYFNNLYRTAKKPAE